MASELGCAGWAWRDMCAAFVAIEDDVDFGGDGLHIAERVATMMMNEK